MSAPGAWRTLTELLRNAAEPAIDGSGHDAPTFPLLRTTDTESGSAVGNSLGESKEIQRPQAAPTVIGRGTATTPGRTRRGRAHLGEGRATTGQGTGASHSTASRQDRLAMHEGDQRVRDPPLLASVLVTAVAGGEAGGRDPASPGIGVGHGGGSVGDRVP